MVVRDDLLEFEVDELVLAQGSTDASWAQSLLHVLSADFWRRAVEATKTPVGSQAGDTAQAEPEGEVARAARRGCCSVAPHRGTHRGASSREERRGNCGVGTNHGVEMQL